MDRLVAAIDVGGTSIKTALVAEDLRVLHTHRTSTRRVEGSVDVGQIIELIDELRAAAGDCEVVGVGVAVPGIVDERGGVARAAVNLGWRDLPLRDRLVEAAGLPVALGHDVRTGGLAEFTVGAATGVTANLDFVRKATHQWMPLGKRVVIIGGELVGLELAEFLSERGREVTVVDDVPRFGKGLTIVRRMRLLAELQEHGVALFPSAGEIAIEGEAVRFVDQAGNAQAVPADHVIVAKGATGELALAERLRADGFVVHAIGDATGVGYIEGAMRGAAAAVTAINEGRSNLPAHVEAAQETMPG